MAISEETTPSKIEKQIDDGRKFMKENYRRPTVNIFCDELECLGKKSPDAYEFTFNTYALGFIKGMAYAQKHMKKKKK